MNNFICFASIASDLAETARGTAEKFGFDWPHFFAQVINFLIVSGVLVVFAYKPIRKVLEERKQRIAEGLANAEKIKQALAQTEASRQEVFNQANLQASKLIEEARAAAAKVLEQETQKAIATANDIIAKARQANETELARMKAELRREVGRLVVSTTAKVTGKVLTVDDQNRLAEETNRQLAA
jgi:F-type H+-transporting ATPase subunit b